MMPSDIFIPCDRRWRSAGGGSAGDMPPLDHRQALHVLELRLAGGVPDAGHHHHDAADDDEARQQHGDNHDISLVHHPSSLMAVGSLAVLGH